MQLILAIDSDTRRSEQLAALVHTRLTVDLVQATSAGEALHVLRDRVPDLILTSPLLSPFDDGVLDEYLRDLGTAAAHIQTLRIPVLSTGQRKGSVAKRLFSLGRKKADPASAASPDGCDPKIFADEIAHYLERSLEERTSAATAVPQTEVHQAQHTAEAVTASEHHADVAEDWTPSYITREEVLEPAFAPLEPLHVVDVEPVEYAYVTPEPVTFVEPEPSYLLAEPEPLALPKPIFEPIAAMEPVEAIESVEPTPRPLPAPAETHPATTTASNSEAFEAALAAIRAAWTAPAPRATPAVPSHAEIVTPRSRAAVSTDEADWAVLDPNTCDFSALVKRLDEVTDTDDHVRQSYSGHETTMRATDVR